MDLHRVFLIQKLSKQKLHYSLFMDDIPKIGITGMPRVGKTNTLIKIIEKIEASGYKIGGMVTEPIIEDKKRVGFYVKDWMTKEKEVFAHITLDLKDKIGKYGVDIDILERVGVPAIERAIEDEDVNIIIIDEIGKMEMLSERFCDIVIEALDSDKPILVTLHKKSRSPLLQDVRRRDDIRILEVTPVNRNLLPYKIEKIMAEKLPPLF
jgi:nucleoside-triphosphatase